MGGHIVRVDASRLDKHLPRGLCVPALCLNLPKQQIRLRRLRCQPLRGGGGHERLVEPAKDQKSLPALDLVTGGFLHFLGYAIEPGQCVTRPARASIGHG